MLNNSRKRSCVMSAQLGIQVVYLLLIPVVAAAQPTMGLLRNEAAAFNGYTLFGNNETTYLIDNCGYVVNSWQSDYKTGHGMYLLDNGDLLRAGSLPGIFDAGGRGGVFELYGWDGQLKWQYRIADNQRHAHHDLAPLPNGNFLASVWEYHSEAEARSRGRQYTGAVWSESIVELQMVGTQDAKIVWEWRVWDHLVQDVDPDKPNYGNIADHPERININYIGERGETSGNWLHVNAIDYHPGLDQVVISSRLWSEFWIIDHNTSTAEAATGTGGQSGRGGDLLYRYGNPATYDRGTAENRQLHGQHDVKWIPAGRPHAGKISLFNNEYQPGQASRIEILGPPLQADGSYSLASGLPYGPPEPIWSYSGNDLYSPNLSGAQFLPNGNLLICEGANGYFFEIDSLEQVVWAYINPVNRNGGPGIQGGTPRFNMTFRATRYAPDHLAFVGKTLLPGDPVELSPDNYDCTIFGTITSAAQPKTGSPESLKILGQPIHQTLRLESPFEQPIDLTLYSPTGHPLHRWTISKGIHQFDLTELPNGLYLLHAAKQQPTLNQLILKQ